MKRPWLEGFAELRDELTGLPGRARLDRLNGLAQAAGLKSAFGLPLNFVDQTDLPQGRSYEVHIAETGRVPTRLGGDGGIHDLYNALMWLRWPQSKACLNALHVQALHEEPGVKGGASGPGVRGRLRDRLTLFDESGLVWVCEDASINAALQEFRWTELFVEHRAALAGSVCVAVFGHAVLQKLERPYKAITAHALILAGSPGHPTGSKPLQEGGGGMPGCPGRHEDHPAASGLLPVLDASLAGALADLAARTARTAPPVGTAGTAGTAGTTGTSASASSPDPGALLCPIPVLGLPGWSPENEHPGFYADEKIFRRGRRPGLQSAPERVGRSLRVPAPGEEGPDSGGQGAG